MRNLKKILALALALVMSLSLMATANAFTDDDSITDTYETAVTVLSGLKVFQGYDDGSFLPQGAITRAEVAAIIYRIVTGDVADTQVGIYADYNKFDDVASTSWYAGYVNFCANAEYIKGYDARTFGPNDPVTGYQALAMILRALGYDKNGEFTGTNWQVQTAAVGEQRGITKNITAGTLGVAATREVVAEILFRAILVPTVNYTPAFGYTIGDTSLGYKTFGLEEITGVVVANEYADLYSDSPMKAGRTELDVDGESYVIDYSTTLEDIGEAHAAYITGSTVLTIEKTGNTVFETGAATDISTDKKFEDASAMERDDATEYFLNFDGGDEYKASDWKIKYVVNFTDDASWTDWDGYRLERVNGGDYDPATKVYTQTINPGKVITATDMGFIKDIFYGADKYTNYVFGEVYVGTQTGEDISDDISYNEFKDKYIETDENAIDVDETDNGEWLKIIDNDNDGVADVVLLTEFAMSFVDRISKDGEYTLADLEDRTKDVVEFNDDAVIDGDDIVTEDELAEGDVVIYTLIDGKYYMSIAEMVTETVDKKGIDSKDETMTCDGTVYTQSHIGYTNDTYYHDVTEAHTEETYDLYLDHFGFVRLFIESDYSTFMLLTDGYYYDNNRDEDFQAYYWDVGADEETLIDVVDNDAAAEFIFDGKRNAVNGNVETWGRLLGAEDTYRLTPAAWQEGFASNIAGYTDTGDGYALKSVEDSAARIGYQVQEFNPDGLKDKTLDAVGTADSIQTTTETQYYLVIRSADNRTVTGWNVDDVITWTGYANAPSEAKLNTEDGPVVGYAVTRATKTSGDYTVADVVVFETQAYADRNTYFVYAPNNWDRWFDDRVEYVYGIGYDDEGAISSENKLMVEDDAADIMNYLFGYGMIQFYEIYDDERVDFIGDDPGEYADHDIYAGQALTGYDVEGRNYIRVDVEGDDDMYISPDAPVYYVYLTSNNDYELTYDVDDLDRDKVDVGNDLILFTDGSDNNVEYAINVSKSTYTFRDVEYVIPAVEDLYNRIVADANYVAPTDLEAAIAAANGVSQVAPMGQVPGTGVTAWDDAVVIYNTLAHLIATESMTEAERNTANTALTGLATKLVYTAKMDAEQKIDAEYEALAPSYTENKADLDIAKAAVDAEVDAWTIDKVIPTYAVPAIKVDGIVADDVALDAAKTAAEERVKAAYEAAVALSDKYDPSLAAAILNQYNLAQNAIAEAKTVAAFEAIDGAAITAVVADCQAVDTAAAAVAKALPKQNVNFVENESKTTALIKTAIEDELKKHDELMKDGSLIVTVAVSEIKTAWGDLSVATPSKDETLTWTISIGDVEATGKIDVTVTAASAKKVADAVAAVKAADKAAAGEFFIANYETTNPGDAAVAAAKALGIDVNVAVSNTANPEKGVHTVELTLTKSSFTATVTVTGTCEKHTDGACA